MNWKTLKYGAVLACTVLTLAGPTAADDKTDAKDKPSLSGVWALKGGEMKLEFADKDVLKISPHGKDDLILIVCSYTVDKTGLVKAKITGLEGQQKALAQDKLPVGLAFNFQWKVKKDTAMLDGVKGDDADLLKAHLEGEYEKK